MTSSSEELLFMVKLILIFILCLKEAYKSRQYVVSPNCDIRFSTIQSIREIQGIINKS